MGVSFINHKGKKILLIDFSGRKAEEVINIIAEAKELIKKQPEKSLLTLTDGTNTRFDPKVAEGLKEFAAHNKPYVRAGAVVGITGIVKIVYNAVMKFSGRNLPAFDDIETAKDWLAGQ